jgi:hypothetical protein
VIGAKRRWPPLLVARACCKSPLLVGARPPPRRGCSGNRRCDGVAKLPWGAVWCRLGSRTALGRSCSGEMHRRFGLGPAVLGACGSRQWAPGVRWAARAKEGAAGTAGRHRLLGPRAGDARGIPRRRPEGRTAALAASAEWAALRSARPEGRGRHRRTEGGYLHETNPVTSRQGSPSSSGTALEVLHRTPLAGSEGALDLPP